MSDLIVGTDSYCTFAEADAYLVDHYTSVDPKMAAWAALNQQDASALLRRAAQIIDTLPLVGMKVTYEQKMAFPRAIYTTYSEKYMPVILSAWTDNTYVQTEVPDAVKYAQAEIAIELVGGVPQREQLRRQGVKSFSVGSMSETYAGPVNAVISFEAQRLLQPYVARSVTIC